jgi:D-alanyl-D-alanine carboxypeptidase
MARLPIAPVVLPSDLRGQANGNLDKRLLVDIPNGRLHHRAADAWLALCALAKTAKVTLVPTSPVDTYRPLAIQEVTFLKRYDNTPRKTAPKKYRGKLWWLKAGYAGAAVPSTSNHGWGLAIDIADMGQTKVEFLLKTAHLCGFSWEAQSEPWHIRYVAGDKVPAAVIAFLNQGKRAASSSARK